MKKFTTIDPMAAEAALLRMREELASGAKLSFEISSKDGSIKNLILRAGQEEIQLDAGYSTLSVSEVERAIRWLVKVDFTEKAAKLLEAHQAKTYLVVTCDSTSEIDQYEAQDQAKKQAKAFLAELENRYRDVANLFEGALAYDFEIQEPERFKLIGNQRVLVDHNGKPKSQKAKDTDLDVPF